LQFYISAYTTLNELLAVFLYIMIQHLCIADSWPRRSRSRRCWRATETWSGKVRISSARNWSRLFPMLNSEKVSFLSAWPQVI